MKHLLRAVVLAVLVSLPLRADTVSSTVTVAATATEVLPVSTQSAPHHWVMISVPSTAARAVFIGLNDASVTTSTGHELQPGEMLCLINAPSSAGSIHPAWSKIHAIVASGTVSIIVSYGD